MASSSLIPGKITLHSTSKIPLSERFKMVQQTALIKKNIEPVVRPARVSVKPLARGSWKNRQLAAALANKPSVRAALKIKKKSIKQRLSVKPKPARGNVAALVNRTFAASRKSTKKSIIERLQVAPATSGNTRRPKLNRSNFVGTTKVAPKNARRISRRPGGATTSLNNNTMNRRPIASKFNKVNKPSKNNNQGGNRSTRQGSANLTARRNQQRLNQQMKNRRLNPSNNFKGNQARQPQRQRQFNRRNNQQQGKPGQQGARGGFKQNQGNRNVNNKRFQNRRPNNRQNQQRRKNPDKNSLDKDLDAYMAKTRNQLDADLDAYMGAT